MPKRDYRLAVRLSDEEKKLCASLALRKGIDPSGVMRQAMLEMAAREGLKLPTKQ